MNLKISLQGSRTIWGILIALSLLSILEVYSASSNMSYSTGHFWKPVMLHSCFVLASLFTAYLLHHMHIVKIKILLAVFYPISLFLLVWAILKGQSLNDANRWLEVAGVSFQPSEIAKITIIGVVSFLFSAGYSKKIKQIRNGWFIASMIVTAIPGLMILKENFSTAIIIIFVMVLLASTADPPRKIFWPLILVILGSAMLGYFTVKEIPQQWAQKVGEMGMQRFPTWVNRIQEEDSLPSNPKDYKVYENVQVTHSRIAIATSGLIGRGLGNSIERDYLPQAYSDFIYAIVIEECGWLVAIVVMLLYLILLYKCFKIADNCKTRYARTLVTGLGLMIVTQAMINMAVATGTFPVTGQPLPLMSKGGTSMLATGSYIGIILSVSRTVKKRKKKQAQEMEQELIKPVSHE